MLSDMRVSPALAAAGASALAIVLASAHASAQGQPPPGYQQQPPPGYQQQPPPGYQQQPPPGYQQQPPPGYQQQPPGYYGYGGPPPPPPPPQKPKSSGFTMPDISIRVDPFNWLLQGRLGFELESSVWKFISVEVVPVFVVNSTPPMFNNVSPKASLEQASNGIGALSGASLDAGFWLEGKPFKGNVLRLIITNYGYTYKTTDGAGTIDQVSHTERQLYGFFGSHMKWGFFTIAGGVGLGVELNQQKRCFPAGATSTSDATSNCSKKGLDIALDRNLTQIGDLNGGFYPVYIMGRLSLGVVF